VHLAIVVFTVIQVFSLQDFYFKKQDIFFSPSEAKSFFKNRLIAKLETFSHEEAVREGNFSIYPDLMVPGALINSGIKQIEFYDSGLPANTKNFFSHYPGRRRYRADETFNPDCRLQFLWFPNNLLRNLNCTLDERGAYYSQNILPFFEPFNPHLLEILGTKYVVDKIPPLDLTRFKRIPTDVSIFDQREQPIDIWENMEFRPGKAAFVEFFKRSPTECQNVDHEVGEPVSFSSDYLTEPVMKSGYQVNLVVRGPGCLKLRVANSPLWKIRLNGQPTSALAGPMFTVIPIHEETITAIQADYFPRLKYLMLFGFMTLICWLIVGPSLLSRILESDSQPKT
jgi:hypothetical protein